MLDRRGGQSALTQSAIGRQLAPLGQRRGAVPAPAPAAHAHRSRARIRGTHPPPPGANSPDTLEVSAGHDKGLLLEVIVAPTFATQWLIPQLPDFSRFHPNITVKPSARTQSLSLQENVHDAAICFDAPFWPNTAQRSDPFRRPDAADLLPHVPRRQPAQG